MFVDSILISPQSSPAEVVKKNFRTARVFSKYGIAYCCGAHWPLEAVCEAQGIDISHLISELTKAARTVRLPSNLPFERWKIDFLIDYIVNIHHHYILDRLPSLEKELINFTEEHSEKLPQYQAVCACVNQLRQKIVPLINQEEEVIFPYLRQVAHAYDSSDGFGRLLVKTLRKPLSNLINLDQALLRKHLTHLRELTANYTAPAHACISHRVVLGGLNEMDDDLTQHLYLESQVLLPRIIEIENILLSEN